MLSFSAACFFSFAAAFQSAPAGGTVRAALDLHPGVEWVFRGEAALQVDGEAAARAKAGFDLRFVIISGDAEHGWTVAVLRRLDAAKQTAFGEEESVAAVDSAACLEIGPDFARRAPAIPATASRHLLEPFLEIVPLPPAACATREGSSATIGSVRNALGLAFTTRERWTAGADAHLTRITGAAETLPAPSSGAEGAMLQKFEEVYYLHRERRVVNAFSTSWQLTTQGEQTPGLESVLISAQLTSSRELPAQELASLAAGADAVRTMQRLRASGGPIGIAEVERAAEAALRSPFAPEAMRILTITKRSAAQQSALAAERKAFKALRGKRCPDLGARDRTGMPLPLPPAGSVAVVALRRAGDAESLAALASLLERRGARGLRAFALAPAGDAEAAAAEAASAPSGIACGTAVSNAFRSTAAAAYVLVDRNGVVRERFVGFEEGAILAAVDLLLAEAPKAESRPDPHR